MKVLLLNSAWQLQQVSIASANEYETKSDQLVDLINKWMLAKPDIENLIGKNNINMMKNNHLNHVKFIASILKNYHHEVLVETVLWVFKSYRSHNFEIDYWTAQLDAWQVILKEVLSKEAFDEIFPFYQWMKINIPLFVKLTDEELKDSNSMH